MAKFDLESVLGTNPLEAALQAEGITGRKADIARSIYQQESGSGKNTRTSNAGARGGMQIIPATFDRMADKGWAIDNPVHNARAGVRYVSQLYDKAGGDPELTGAGYYGGEGAIKKARNGVAVSDPRNPKAPNTLQYGQQVASRLPAETTAQPKAQRFDLDAVLRQPAAPKSDRTSARLDTGRLKAAGETMVDSAAGLGTGVGQVALGAQKYLGKFANAIGADTVGYWLTNDAEQGRNKLTSELAPHKARSPIAAGIGEVGGNVAATIPVGGAFAQVPKLLAKVPMLASQAPRLNAAATALRTGGFRTGLPAATTTVGKVGQMALRSGAGAAVGGVSAGLVDENSADMGAAIGGFAPPVLAGAGKIAHATGNALRGGGADAAVTALAQRAKELGINIPADRLVNSRPMNAVAASLNYVPFSGRAATETTMNNQLTKAASRLIGQDSDNMMHALRKAGGDLGGKFDATLKANRVNLDNTLMDDIINIDDVARQQLGDADYRAIYSQVSELLKKGETGAIDGQAAYNIKRTLDRMGRGSGPSAFHALELKRALIGGLDRSLGPKEAAAFAKTRQQYGNMIALEKIAQNGVEGDISIARLANMKNINNEPLQEIADIAAQFVKPRESQHGAMQRAVAAMGIGSMTGLPGLAATATAGKATNMLLNTNAARNFMLQQPGNMGQGVNRLGQKINPALYRAAPVLAADR